MTIIFEQFDETVTKLRDEEQKFKQAVSLIREVYYVTDGALHDQIYEFLCDVETCSECQDYDRIHDARCPLHPDHDPTPE